MSSRNRYLSPEQRQTALCLWNSLTLVKQLIHEGQRDIQALEAAMQGQLIKGGADLIDYARIVHQESLADIHSLDQPSVALIAARVGSTRLIDNLLLSIS